MNTFGGLRNTFLLADGLKAELERAAKEQEIEHTDWKTELEQCNGDNRFPVSNIVLEIS